MCPPAPDRPADTFLNGADEDVIMYLDRFRHGNPLPNNVIDYINPYQYKPANLPGEIWYLVSSIGKKETVFGLWREKDAPSEILTSSAISGQRTTLEFIEFQDTRQQKTNWVMQEFKLAERGLCKEKESRAMCRIFLSEGRSLNMEMRPNSRESVIVDRNYIPSAVSVVQNTNSTSEQGSGSVSLVGPLALLSLLVNNGAGGNNLPSDADRILDPRTRDISELMFDGDFLELDDLANPQSSSTSSDNSSCSSVTLDEYFDSHALWQELEDKKNKDLQEKDSNSKFSVTASVQPFEVVMQPATLGSLVCATGRQQPVGCTVPTSILNTQNVGERTPDHTVKKLEAKKKDKDSSRSSGVATPLNSGKSMSKGKEKASGIKMKRIKKCFCFMPF